jgi:hypothetical protein
LIRYAEARQALEAFSRATTPTALLVQTLCAAVAQILADALHAPVVICLPGNIRIERKPREGK